MRKFVALSAALVLVALVVPAASAGKGKQQVVEGSVALPAKHPDGCYAGIHRRMAIMTQEQVNGVVGYHFDVDKKTWGQPFVLEVTGGAGYVDLDIVFYQKFGTPEDVIGDPGGAGAPPSITFEERNAEGEFGTVPPKFVKAIVCLFPDENAGGGGLGATFTYTAGKGVKLPKK
jgi:hypothetical protein